MDLRQTLSRKLDVLPQGDHTRGLSAVLSHIEAAIGHLDRGQRDSDDTCFTDVIFRCNQAFEGSIKEAYRVLAAADPKGRTINDIEKFLAQGNRLRKKVLDQFTRYRQDWRNPSTHDYTLDFDEDEALLAIVSVTAFAIVLSDQIAAELAFAQAAAMPVTSTDVDPTRPLLDLVAERALIFVQHYRQMADDPSEDDPTNQNRFRYLRAKAFEGEFGGFLAAELSGHDQVVVEPNAVLATGPNALNREADIIVTRGEERVVVEIKHAQPKSARSAGDAALGNIQRALQVPGITGALAVVYTGSDATYLAGKVAHLADERIRFLGPV